MNSIFFEAATEAEVIAIVNSLRPGTAAGYDGIPTWSVNEFIGVISKPLTHIINLSLQSGIVPDQLKIARVIPLFKSGEDGLISNYRPISILPVFSKLFEKVVYSRLINYFDSNNILFKNQYGFRKNHSTSLALLDLVDKITLAIDERKYTVGIFLDLSKAFDTVNHDILFDKLSFYGIRGLPLDWLKSYKEYNGSSSLYNSIKCGVPQGSILGPLLFLIYINDICNASELLEFVLFADDTNLFYSHDDLSYLNTIINSELDKLSIWLQTNKLSVNTNKSNYIVFKPRQRRQLLDLNLEINKCSMNQVSEVVFLGVILDEHLSWKPHISHIARKISKSIGVIFKSSSCLPKSSLLLLYYSLVYPYLQYCVTVWGSTYRSNLERLIRLQKRVVRSINKDAYDAHTDPIFNELRILKFNDIYLLNLGKFMYSYQHGLLPSSFNDYFIEVNQVHHYNTRSSSDIYTPFCKTKIRQFSVTFQGPKFFNMLSSDIKKAYSLQSFQNKLKKYLMSKYL